MIGIRSVLESIPKYLHKSPCTYWILKGNFEYCLRASFLHWETGKVVLVPSFASIQVSDTFTSAGPRSAVGNVSGYRCKADCRFRGREFDPGPVPYFRGDWSWNNFYGHSPPFRWIIHEGLLSVTSESMCTNYWLPTCSSLPRKKCA